MVTQPSTCLRLSDNRPIAGTITWWRRLPEEFRRNPIVRMQQYSAPAHYTHKMLNCCIDTTLYFTEFFCGLWTA